MKQVCKICGSTDAKKNGFVSGFQRYKCKNCGHQYIKDTPRGKPKRDKQIAMALYELGLSQNFIAHITSVTATSVGRWVADMPECDDTIIPAQMNAAKIADNIRKLEKNNKSPAYVITHKLKDYQVDVIIKKTTNNTPAKSVSISAFGDSILRGVTWDSIRAKYAIVKNNVMNARGAPDGISCKNFARHGSTVIDGNKTFTVHQSDAKDSDYVFLLFGGNEANFDWDAISENPTAPHHSTLSVDDFCAKYNDLIAKIKQQNKTPVLFSLPPICPQRYFEFVSRNRNRDNIMTFLQNDLDIIYRWHEIYNLAIFKIAQQNDVRLIDIRTAFLQHRDYRDYLSYDGIHPNKRGYQLISDLIRETYQVDMCF